MCVLVHHGDRARYVPIFGVMLVPMRVFAAVGVAMEVRVAEVAMVMTVGLAPAAVCDPSAESDERKRSDDIDRMSEARGGGCADRPDDRAEDQRRDNVTE